MLRRVTHRDEAHGAEWAAQFVPAEWPRSKAAVAERFRACSRDEWVAAFAGYEACVAPVLGGGDDGATILADAGLGDAEIAAPL